MKFYLTKKAQLAAEAADRSPRAAAAVPTVVPAAPALATVAAPSASAAGAAPLVEATRGHAAAKGQGKSKPQAKSKGRASIEPTAQSAAPAPKTKKPKRNPHVIAIGGSPRVDLLPQEVRQERRSAQNVRRAWIGVIGIAAIAILASAGATVYSTTAKATLANEQSATNGLIAGQSKYASVRVAQQKVDLIKAAQSVGGSTEIDWNSYLAKVQATLPAGVTVTSIDLTSSSPLIAYTQATVPLQGSRVATLTFTATSATLPSVPTWLDGLTKLPGFADATPGSVAFSDGIYTAKVTMHINEAAYSGRYTSKDK